MPRYSDELIEDIRSRNDIVDVIGEYIALKKKGTSYFGLCPFHGEKTPSFSVNPARQTFHCFGCGEGGNVYTFLMKIDNMTFPEAVEELAEKCGVELPKQEMTREKRRLEDKKSRLFEINKEAAIYFHELLKSKDGEHALGYLRKRGLSWNTIVHFGLGCSSRYSDALYKYLKKKGYDDAQIKESGLCVFDEKKGWHDRFWNRVMFPIMDARGHVIGFGGRVTGDGEPKYLNTNETPVFDKSKSFYGINFAKSTRENYFILCEGYLDAISLHQAGFTNALAALGTAFTEKHADVIKRYKKDVYLSLDSDGAGRKAAVRALGILRGAGIEAKVISMDPYKDPDEFIKAKGADAYKDLILGAENSFMYEVRMRRRDFDMQDPAGSTAFYREVARMLLRFPEKLERQNYILAISGEYGVKAEYLEEMTGSAGAGGTTRNARQTDTRAHGFLGNAAKEDGSKVQRYMLTWLASDESLFDATRDFLSPEDFTGDVCHRCAELLYAQHEDGCVNVAAIISRFEDEGQQGLASAIFSEDLGEIKNISDKERNLKEALIRIKKENMRNTKSGADDVNAPDPSETIREKRIIRDIEKKRFFSE